MRGKLSVIIAKYRNNLAGVQRVSCTLVASKVITRTPVDSGSARASWTPSLGSTPRVFNIDKTVPGLARNDVAVVVSRMQPGDRFNLVNGQPYIRRLEYEGHSSQTAGYTPDSMMRSSLLEWKQIVAQAIRDVRK